MDRNVEVIAQLPRAVEVSIHRASTVQSCHSEVTVADRSVEPLAEAGPSISSCDRYYGVQSLLVSQSGLAYEPISRS
jgi:hypothetical protein